MRMMTKSRSFLKKNTAYTRHTKVILAQYQRIKPTTTYVRQSRVDSKTCIIPGWAGWPLMMTSWLNEIQSFADRNDIKFYDALKTVYGPKSSGTTPLLKADGSILLTDKDAILKRSAKHFQCVLSRPPSTNGNAINRLSQVECTVLLNEFPTDLKQRKQFSSCHWTRLRDQTQYLQRSIEQEGQQWQRNLQRCFTACVERRKSHKMQP